MRAASLDHLVSAGEQDRREVETQRSCGLEVDHELELGPLLDRQIGWFCTLENFVDEGGGSIPHVFETGRIREQATRLGHLPESADQRQTVSCRRLGDTRSIGYECSIIQHEDGIGWPLPHHREISLEVFGPCHFQTPVVEAEQTGGRFYLFYEYRMRRISRLLKDCDPYSLRHDLLQQFQSLHCQFRGQDG